MNLEKNDNIKITKNPPVNTYSIKIGERFTVVENCLTSESLAGWVLKNEERYIYLTPNDAEYIEKIN